jgi:Phytanoyl-CoA dioxygenase (PhyH)
MLRKKQLCRTGRSRLLRGLLALFLFTDVGENDALTRLLPGSHLIVPKFVALYGVEGTSADAQFWYPSTLGCPMVHATGSAGDVFLCHPFIVHTATCPHCGTESRMIAQPAVHSADGLTLDGTDPSPIARAIAAGLAMAD